MQASFGSQGQPGMPREFYDSQRYTKKPFLEKSIERKKKDKAKENSV